MTETPEDHARRTRHTVTMTNTEPWRCQDCPARSPFWDLTNEPAKRSEVDPS